MPKYCIHNVMSVIKLFKVAHGRHKITPYVDCVTKELRSNPALKLLKIIQKQTFSETNNTFIPSFGYKTFLFWLGDPSLIGS